MTSVRSRKRTVRIGELALLFILIAGGVLLFFQAMPKMLDQAAIADMEQASRYISRAVKPVWSNKESETARTVSQEELDKLLEAQGISFSPKVHLYDDELTEGTEIRLSHDRFGESVFSYPYQD